MTGYSFKILNNSVRALNAQQAVIAATGNNVANVNTPGYSRRVVALETDNSRRAGSTALDIGAGVQVRAIERVADEYLTGILREAQGKKSFSELQNALIGRVDKLFDISGDQSTIAQHVNAFYASLNDLSSNPASIELRKNVIERGRDLINSISNTYNTLAAIQDEANDRLDNEVQSVNTLTALIAETNANVVASQRAGNVSADDLDRRDVLIQQLAEKISFRSVETAEGAINIYLDNGFNLVQGNNSNAIKTTTTPSFNSSSEPPSLSGGVLKYIVYDYSGGADTGHIDLTQILKNGQGSIGALLTVRGYNSPGNTSSFDADGPLVEVASRVEAIARDLLTRFNFNYQGADEDSVTAGFQSNALNLNGNAPAIYGFFDFNYSGIKDADGNGRPGAGDFAALSIDNYSSILQLAITDPRDFAAARDENAANGAVTLVPGNGENVEALVALQTASATFSAGSYSLTGTYDDVYKETVAHVSSLKTSAQNRADLDQDNLLTAQTRRDEVSAVSLDEEFAALIKYQKAFQASAKMIGIADELMKTIIGLI